MAAVTLDFDISSLLDSDPGHMDGRPFIRGTRVSVERIATLHNEGVEPGEIARRMAVPLPGVHAALSFYLSRRLEIDADLEEQDREYFRLAAKHRQVPASL